MRLIRAVLQPVSKRWYSSAAACASSSGTTKKACVRVPKEVRKSMVESFVNRYQKANAGKFPTVSEAKKDVGGSYYVIREILQELIYNSKMLPPVDTKTARDIQFEKDSQATEMEEEIINSSPISKVAVQDSGSEIIESNQHPQPSISVASDDESKDGGKQSCHLKDEPRSIPHLDPENDKTAHEDEQKSNDKTAHEDGQKLDGSESTEVSGRELQKVSTKDADKTGSSFWQNMKTLANEILEMWKKN